MDASHLYWSDTISGTIMAANLDGTVVTTLVTGQDQPEGVAVPVPPLGAPPVPVQTRQAHAEVSGDV